MLTNHRHGEILARLRGAGRVGMAEVAAVLQVSDETMRRDLKQLERQSLIRRIHGCAVPQRLDRDRPRTERGRIAPSEKARVAALAQHLVQDGMSVFIDTGTSTLALGLQIKGRQLAVTTNPLDVALMLADGPAAVAVTPGTVRAKDHALAGYETVAYAQRYFFDIAFMDISACDFDHGWMDHEEHESVLRRASQKQARRVVILAESGRFGRHANLNTFALDAPLTLVTARPPPKPFLDTFDRHDIEIISA